MRRLGYLDSLRGFAALYVLIYHVAKMPSLDTGLFPALDAFVLSGGTGVYLFFVISAFCLCLTMPARDVTGAVVAEFYVKRFFRIAPLFYVVAALTMTRNLWVFGALPPNEEIAANAAFVFNLVPGMQDSLVFAGWTIGVEMLFYLIFPSLFVLLRRLPAKVLAYPLAGVAFRGLLLALAAAPLTEGLKERYALLTVVHYIPVFLVGMIAFDLHGWLLARGASWRTGAACLAAGTLCFALTLGDRLHDPAIAPFFWQSAAFGLMLLGFAFCPLPLLVNRATRFLGRISYSVYLLHGPVILLINRPVFPRIYALDLPTPAKFGLCLGVTLAVTLTASWLSYRLVERPGIALARKLIAAWRRNPELAPQPA